MSGATYLLYLLNARTIGSSDIVVSRDYCLIGDSLRLGGRCVLLSMLNRSNHSVSRSLEEHLGLEVRGQVAVPPLNDGLLRAEVL